MLDPKNIFPIGIGTWGLGGFVEKDNSIDFLKQEKAVIYMLNSGMNYVEANLWYSQGTSVEIVAKALKSSKKRRSEVFICQAVYLKENNIDDVDAEIDKVFKLFDTDYIDTFQFTQSVFSKYGLRKVVGVVDRLFKAKKIRFTSITNENLKTLEDYYKYYGKELFAHEVCFNFEIRENITFGQIPFAQKHKIKTVVYQPLRRNKTALRNWPLLVNLSEKYKCTQNQLLFAWMVSKGFLPLTKSETVEHIDEHIGSLSIKLLDNDIKHLDNFVIPDYRTPKVDWNKTGDGIDVSQLSNVFDEEYEKQNKK